MLRRVTRVALALAVSTALVVGARAGTDESEPVAAYRKARTELLPKLRALVAWADAGQFFHERNRACEAVLVFEPDDDAARRTLHFARGKDGKWTRGIVPKSSPPDAEHAAEVAAKHEETYAGFRDAVTQLFGGTAGTVPTRERALDELIGVEPDCAAARALNREELVGDKWLLKETATTKRRRKELTSAMEAARRTSPAPVKDAPNKDEAAIAPWIDVRDVGRIRVLGAPRTLETEAVARNASIVLSTCDAVMGVPAPPKARVRLFLFGSKADGLAALGRDKRVSAEDQEWAKSLASFSVDKSDDVYVWSNDAGSRVESGMRQIVIECLWGALGVKSKPIWAREGVCHWYSEIVLGTHNVNFVRRTEYADPTKPQDDLRKRLFDEVSDWLGEARTLDKAGRWPDLRITMSRDASTSTAEDVLLAYCLARYLVEGRPDGFAVAMRAVADAKRTPDSVAASLDATVEGLDRRLRRWLRETK